MPIKNTTTIFDLAHKLHTLGFSVLPSGGGEKGKAPLINWIEFQSHQATEGDIEKWQIEFKPSLWGIVTNDHIAVIDADTPEARTQLEAELGEPHVTTPRGGAHWYIDTTGHPMKTVAGLLPGIDVRGVGGFVNIIGGKYQILRLPVPGKTLIPWARLPERLLAALDGNKPPATGHTNEIGSTIPRGQNDSYLTSRAGSYRRKGDTEAQIFEKLKVDVLRLDQDPVHPYTERDLQRIARSIGRYKPESNAISLTDTGNAELLVSLFGNQIRYDHRRQRWLLWRCHHWEPDHDGYISRLAIEATRQRYCDSVNIEDLKERQRVAAWAISSESRMRIDACISLARNIKPIADSGDNWDRDPWLLGVNNGVIDLKTGELRPGQPDDRITMTTGVDFDPQAKCPRWEQFLTEVFGDIELTDWLWRALGYSVSGDTTEQCIFIGHGSGANGKGVFNGALHASLGNYAYSSPFSTFELYQRASIPNDLAALEFKRFVNSSETNDDTRLNEARIKAISGCDPITARYLHQEYFTYWPHLKLWLFVNHRPKVADNSFGFWRRVRLIPFIKQFTGGAEDKHLGEKLRTEAPGILAWLVRGCLEWQKRGLEPVPECVKVATLEYKQESDILAGFISDKCIEDPKATIKASELYSAYKGWAEGEGMRVYEVLSSTAFGRRMRDRYQKDKKGGTVHYFGIGLSGQLQDSSEVNDTENDVSPICNASREITKETILNYPSEANNRENYPGENTGAGVDDSAREELSSQIEQCPVKPSLDKKMTKEEIEKIFCK